MAKLKLQIYGGIMKKYFIVTACLLVAFTSLVGCKKENNKTEVIIKNYDSADSDEIKNNGNDEVQTENTFSSKATSNEVSLSKEYSFNGLTLELPDDMYYTAEEKNEMVLVLKPTAHETEASMFEIITNDKLKLFADNKETADYIYNNIETIYSQFDNNYGIHITSKDYNYSPDKQIYNTTFTCTLQNVPIAAASDIIATADKTVMYISLSVENNIQACKEGLTYLHSLEK